MIGRTDVDGVLDLLHAKFVDVATPPTETKLVAKLATLEVAGWTEDCMKRIVLDAASSRLASKPLAQFTADVVNKTHGFTYDAHFRRLLVGLVGHVGTAAIESSADPTRTAVLRSKLQTLKTNRNTLAHTHTRSAASAIAAPSVLRKDLDAIEAGLLELESALARIVIRI